MDIKMTLNELTAMLDRLNVNYIVDEVNKYILHLNINKVKKFSRKKIKKFSEFFIF